MTLAHRLTRVLLATCACGVITVAGIPTSMAETPWGMIAAHVIGRVARMSQAPKGEQPGFDVATVVLKADAGKVYATAVSLLRKNQSVRIVAEDPAQRTVEINNGMRSAGLTVTALGTRLSQILVASAIMPGQDSATLRIVDGILNVCQEMKVTCSTR